MLKKLSAYPRQNGLAKALREIGRIERALFTLDWIKNPDLRRRAHLGLNKGEARNALARAVYFCRLGEVRDRSFENQFFRASGLNLLVAAIILWNTKYLEVAYTELPAPGRDDQRGPVAACRAARLGAHRADRRLRLEHRRSTASRYAQTAAAAAISTGGLSSLNVPDVVHSEYFRVVTPSWGSRARSWRCGRAHNSASRTARAFAVTNAIGPALLRPAAQAARPLIPKAKPPPPEPTMRQRDRPRAQGDVAVAGRASRRRICADMALRLAQGLNVREAATRLKIGKTALYDALASTKSS